MHTPTDDERNLHISHVELKAIFLAICSFLYLLTGQTLAVHSDYTTAVSYINKQRSIASWSLCKMALDLREFCIQNDIFPIDTYILGTENTVADAFSRVGSEVHKWSLNHHFLLPIFQEWVFLDIDVFANRVNSKCLNFCTKEGTDPLSMGDVFTWTGQDVSYTCSLLFYCCRELFENFRHNWQSPF